MNSMITLTSAEATENPSDDMRAYLEGATNHATGTPLTKAEARVKELEGVLNALACSEWFHGGMGVYDPKHMTQLRAQVKAALADTKGTPPRTFREIAEETGGKQVSEAQFRRNVDEQTKGTP